MRVHPLLVLSIVGLCLAQPMAGVAAGAEEAGAFSAADAVKAYLAENDLGKANDMIKSWHALPAGQRVAVLKELAVHLEERTPLPTVNTADCYVMWRLAAGKMEFYGHGLMSRQDFFIAGGKAAWGIERFLEVGCPLGIIETQADAEWETAALVLRQMVGAYAKGIDDAGGGRR